MNILPINQPIVFTGYKSKLKSLFKSGQLPTVKYGFYGDELTVDNCSVEHLEPHSKGGKTIEENLVLASKEKNRLRGNKQLKEFFDKKAAIKYFSQFVDVVVGDFHGNRYIKSALKTINKLLNS